MTVKTETISVSIPADLLQSIDEAYKKGTAKYNRSSIVTQSLKEHLKTIREAQITAYYKERAEEYDQLAEGLKRAAANIASDQEKDEYDDL